MVTRNIGEAILDLTAQIKKYGGDSRRPGEPLNPAHMQSLFYAVEREMVLSRAMRKMGRRMPYTPEWMMRVEASQNLLEWPESGNLRQPVVALRQGNVRWCVDDTSHIEGQELERQLNLKVTYNRNVSWVYSPWFNEQLYSIGCEVFLNPNLPLRVFQFHIWRDDKPVMGIETTEHHDSFVALDMNRTYIANGPTGVLEYLRKLK